jgi:hypothetical protein
MNAATTQLQQSSPDLHPYILADFSLEQTLAYASKHGNVLMVFA